MNKVELIEAIANTSRLSKREVERFVGAFVEVIKKTLRNNEKISLVGFGTFQVLDRKATTGINPQTKKPMHIPAKKVPKLKFSDTLTKALNVDRNL